MKRKPFLLRLVLMILSGCSSSVQESIDETQPPPILTSTIEGEELITPTLPDDQSAEKKATHLPVKKHKVGILLPLTGVRSHIGQSLWKAIELSFFESGENILELIVKDTKSSPEVAKESAQALVQSGCEVIVGPIFADEVSALTPVVSGQNVSVLSFSNDPKVARDNIFILGFSPKEQLHRLLAYVDSLGVKKISALLPRNAYGDLVSQNLLSLQEELGFQIIALERYETGQQNFASYREKLKLPETQALLLIDGEKTANKILSDLDMDDSTLDNLRILGLSQWDHLPKPSSDELQGAMFVAPDPSLRAPFMSNFENTYHQAPERISSLAYDALSLLTALGRQNEIHPFKVDTLLQPSGFEGIEGLFRLKSDGTSERRYAVLQFSHGVLKVLSPSNTKF